MMASPDLDSLTAQPRFSNFIRSITTGAAGRINQGHVRVKWMMQQADWKSAAWIKIHPMVAHWLDGGPNYVIDNLSNGGRFGGQGGAVMFANRPTLERNGRP
jgi:hypothetical protein